MYKSIMLLGFLSFIGCSKPTTDNNVKTEYTIIDPLAISIPDSSDAETLTVDRLVVYTGLTAENMPVKMASCKGCHFSCPHCVEE